MLAKNLILPFLFGWTSIAYSQPVEEAVYLQRTTHLDISLSGSLIKIQERNVSEKLFHEHFEKHSHESLFYSDLDPIISFEAETVVPAGSGKRIKVSTSETRDIVQPGVFYGGYKRKEFVYPAISRGSIGRLSYTKEIKDPHILVPFYFADDISVKTSRFSVTVPQNMVLRYNLFGNATDKIQFNKEVIRDKVHYSWTMTEVPAWQREKDAPGRAYTSPHVIVFIESYEEKGTTHKVLSGVNDLYSWYSSLIRQIPAQHNNEELKQLVSQLTAGLNTEKEKVKVIFQWVQKNIRYVAFEDGMAGFIPRSAVDVYIKRYGDCKDMANLLKYMINLCGIEAYHTWIGTRDRPYSYESVPSAIADNHMICSVKFGEEFVFLDATNPFLSFGNPTSMIQGKEALVGIDDQRFRVIKVPVLDKNSNQRLDSIYISSNDRGLTGSVSSELTGYRKDDLEVQALRASLNQDKEYIRDFFKIGNNNIQIENVALHGLGEPDKKGRINFKFFQPGYYKKIGDKMYVNLAINKTMPGEKLDLKVRRHPRTSEYYYSDHSVTIYEIPKGYTVSYLPEDKSGDWPDFGFRSSYKVMDDKIYFTLEVYSSHLNLEKNGFESWNNFIQALSDVNNQTVSLAPKLIDK
jgi:transglutaminase-like putative cysteine protease